MRKGLVLLTGLLMFTGMAYAQKVEVFDTVRVAALQSFNVPSVGALVLANILKFEFTAELFDANMRKLRDIETYTRKPKKEDMAKATSGGRGTTVWLVLHDRIEEPGTYYAKISLNASGELGALKKDVFYMITVSHPSMAAPIALREKYYFGEKESFSFATVDYPNPTLYSYEILDGSSSIEKGNGPVVKLDSVLKTASLVGKKLTVKGYYREKEFRFLISKDGEPQKAEWEFTIDQPSLEIFHTWQTKEDDNWLISVDNAQCRAFWFVYIGNTPNGFAVTTPEISGLRYSCEPSNFLSGTSQRKNGSFRIVDLSVNQDFLDQMAVGSEQKVKVKLSFRTQFGEQKNYEFHAVVIK